MLEILGVDHWGEEAYLALIDGNPLTADELAGVTTIERDLLGAVLQRLEDRGLISRVPGQPVRYAALPPETAIEVLLLSRERDIKRVRALAHHLGERHRSARSGRDAAELIEVISGPDAVARAGQQLLRRAQKTIRGIDRPPYARVIDGERVSSHVNVEHSVHRRFIHEHGTLRLPGQTRHLEASVAAGEEVRVLADVPMKMILADDDLGLIPLRATPRVLDSCILVHPSSLLDALSTLFETLWRQGQPFLPGRAGDGRQSTSPGAADIQGDEPLSEEERRIIALLALGLPDEAIARQLDIGHRTVQRRIQALMVRLSATSRFQAGVLAARRGWWDPDAVGA
ncbi:hypothetical protein Sme01_14270 [Sphaerisporangium melleum]|uniref:HTH luxR-type domain-containing protein n=1 Tax=Sphaerisporangium melleum TaxID=321316 RepID=A0A917VE26_9ACTN|nr:helix-turn-helix domain-containing protein [Sphaerisporangium melleum]GGK68933.1 hypothetical protein GCM10007964_09870 [Sphaerisporangium melleum]GII68951.1 hypothetical protein Sme01_14270 [Sphaerisporangium melleum]